MRQRHKTHKLQQEVENHVLYHQCYHRVSLQSNINHRFVCIKDEFRSKNIQQVREKLIALHA
jgi:hypothetical protein